MSRGRAIRQLGSPPSVAALGTASGPRRSTFMRRSHSHGIGPGAFEFAWNRSPHYDGLRSGRALALPRKPCRARAGSGSAAVVLLLGGLLGVGVALAVRERGDPVNAGYLGALLAAFVVFLAYAGYDWMWEETAVAVFGLWPLSDRPGVGEPPRASAATAGAGPCLDRLIALGHRLDPATRTGLHREDPIQPGRRPARGDVSDRRWSMRRTPLRRRLGRPRRTSSARCCSSAPDRLGRRSGRHPAGDQARADQLPASAAARADRGAARPRAACALLPSGIGARACAEEDHRGRRPDGHRSRLPSGLELPRLGEPSLRVTPRRSSVAGARRAIAS